MNVLFIPCYTDGLPYTTASVRFRAEWPARYWPEAEVYPNMTRRLLDYDAYVFQKAYLTQWTQETAAALRAKGKLLAFDICDADWLRSQEHERRLLNALRLFDFAVCPTAAIQSYMNIWLPAHVIPDRIDLEEYKPGISRLWSHPSLVWFGYSHNLGELDHIWQELEPVLDDHDLPLTILSDGLPPEWACRKWGDGRSPAWVKWTSAGANAEIAKHSIALVPQRDRYKSDNRSTTAWALGVVPVAGVDAVLDVLDLEDILAEQAWGRDYVRRERDVRQSVAEWKGLLEKYAQRPGGVLTCDPNTKGDPA